MMDEQQTAAHKAPSFRPTFIGVVLLVAAVCTVGAWSISRFVAHDTERDLRQWQDKLNLIAASRAEDVNKWVSQHFGEMRGLAANPSLQLYMTELQMQSHASKPISAEPAQKTYLRNLLTFTAERTGFADTSTANLDEIHANVERHGGGGIAVIDNEGQILVANSTMPKLEGVLAEKLAEIPRGAEGFIDMIRNDQGQIQIGFIVPIYALQGEQTPEFQIGRIVGIKEVNENLFALLHHPGITEKTLESVLVRKEGDNIFYLSPLLDGTRPMVKQLPYTPERLAEANAIEATGNFIALPDYRSHNSFMTSRSINGTPWTLLVKIDRNEAMHDSDVQRTSLVVGLILVMLLLTISLVAVWWFVSSRRSQTLSTYFRKLAGDIATHKELLQLVTDNQPDPIYILDEDGTYRFANKQAAEERHMTQESMIGKTVGDVQGAGRAQPTINACQTALASQQLYTHVQRMQEQGEDVIIRSEYIPLDHIPIPGIDQGVPGVLVVEHDITESIIEREKRLRSHKQLVETLVMLVDRRDPHAGNHSALVAHVAEEIAIGMELPGSVIETARTAGRLMNIGKIVVSSRLLTKADNLKENELKAIRESLTHSADLLKEISFDGPVVETLHQAQEAWDASGPHSLRGEEILIEARIIAVANAFIGMISPRAWRAAMNIDEAIKILLEEAGKIYDRRVVIALVHYLDNKSGRAVLKSMMDKELPQVANG